MWILDDEKACGRGIRSASLTASQFYYGGTKLSIHARMLDQAASFFTVVAYDGGRATHASVSGVILFFVHGLSEHASTLRASCTSIFKIR